MSRSLTTPGDPEHSEHHETSSESPRDHSPVTDKPTSEHLERPTSSAIDQLREDDASTPRPRLLPSDDLKAPAITHTTELTSDLDADADQDANIDHSIHVNDNNDDDDLEQRQEKEGEEELPEKPPRPHPGRISMPAEDDADARAELHSILTQSIPPTPSASSTRSSRTHSFSFRRPTPEPDLPFDFARFQEQLRSKSAEPVAKYLKSFLHEFGKRQWSLHEQDKIVRDFIGFIRSKMLSYEPFRSMSAGEFDNAVEGMEKLILNRLYPMLFPSQVQDHLGRSTAYRLGMGPDLDRDVLIAEQIHLHAWVQERHLDLPEDGANARFLSLAAAELDKLDSFRAPRDKVICVLNCCKVIFGLLRARKAHPSTAQGSSSAPTEDSSADAFLPLLILTILRTRVTHLASHVEFVLRFRADEKLQGEAGYYLSSLQGALGFIETLSQENLTVEDAEYESEVNAARTTLNARKSERRVTSPNLSSSVEDDRREAASTRPSISQTGSSNTQPPASRSLGDMLPGRDLVFEKASGLLSIAKPRLGSIGRLFSQEDPNTTGPGTQAAALSPPASQGSAVASLRRISGEFPRDSATSPVDNGQLQTGGASTPRGWFSNPFGSLTSTSLTLPTDSLTGSGTGTMPTAHAPAELVTKSQARRAREQERAEALASLKAMFGRNSTRSTTRERDLLTDQDDYDEDEVEDRPDAVDDAVIEAVLYEKRWRLGPAIDALLEIAANAAAERHRETLQSHTVTDTAADSLI
ncbi:hypothetical protein PYCC9005_003105 [Savitreella phatthalungensis]